MALTKEVYQALEDIVGPDYISDDPALLDSYIYPQNATSVHLGPFYHVYTPRGGAVLLPAAPKRCRRSSRSVINIRSNLRLPAPSGEAWVIPLMRMLSSWICDG